MNLGAIIEVAIGVVFIWLILSLSAIQILEWIASLFKIREKDLEKAIGQMLANSQLTREFYEHPLIRGLIHKPGEKPTYIPPREFVQTVFNIVITAGTEKSAIQQAMAAIKGDVIAKQLADFWKRFAKKNAEKLIDKLIENAELLAADESKSIIEQIKEMKEYKELVGAVPEVGPAMDNIPAAVQEYLQAYKDANLTGQLTDLEPKDIENGIKAIGKINPNLKRSLESMLAGVNKYASEAEKGLTNARTNMESWFNSSMESLSGWYKRRSQVFAFFIGLLLSVMLSVDSIALVQRLWIDPTVRAALLENASAFKLPAATPASVTATSTPEATGTGPPTVPGETGPTEVVAPADTIRNFQTQFAGLELPLGWIAVHENPKLQCELFPQRVENPPPDTILFQGIMFFWDKEVCYRPIGTTVPLTSTKPSYEDVLKTNWLFAWCIGILLSAVATTQGAPFWFDILNKLINLRGAGTRPPTTQESTSQK